MVNIALETAEDKCTFPLCGRKSDRGGYCLSHAKYFSGPKPKKQPIGIAKVSDKRKVDEREYKKIVKAMLAENSWCEIMETGCERTATGLHHQKKRTPATYLDTNFLIRACNNCQLWVEIHPLEAIERGYSKSKFAKAI